jgi:hypothetical protein
MERRLVQKENRTGGKTRLTGEAFDALAAEEKERIFCELDNLTPEQMKARFRPLTARERREHFKPRKRGRPRLGKAGTENISVSLEKSFLREVNAFAKAKGIKHSELIASALRNVMGKTERGTGGPAPIQC